MVNELNTHKSFQKALFLDRDGVININHGYVFRRENFTLVDGIVELIKQANELGYLVIVVTNQSGIGRGLYTEQQFIELTDWMLELFASHNAHIDKVYYCPHHPSEAKGDYSKVCDCRKPNPGMAINAINDFDIDVTNSVMVGDKTTDIEFAVNAKIPIVYWLSSEHEAFVINCHANCTITKISFLTEITLA